MYGGQILPKVLFPRIVRHASSSNVVRGGGPPRARIRKGNVAPALGVPGDIPRPPRPGTANNTYGEIKDEATLAKMRQAARIASDSLVAVEKFIRENTTTEGDTGMGTKKMTLTTSDIDYFAQEFVMERSAYPVGVGFHGFPRAICTSVNEVAVHGVPDDEPLSAGDIINCDVSTFIDGVFGDTSKMFVVGGATKEDALALCRDTRDAMWAGIRCVRPGVRVQEIGAVIEKFAHSRGRTVIGEFSGHFIGNELHMRPNVPNTRNNIDLTLHPGMVFTIEPILSGGSNRIAVWDDQWTYSTQDASYTAQFEHTILVTETGFEVLTLSELDPEWHSDPPQKGIELTPDYLTQYTVSK